MRLKRQGPFQKIVLAGFDGASAVDENRPKPLDALNRNAIFGGPIGIDVQEFPTFLISIPSPNHFDGTIASRIDPQAEIMLRVPIGKIYRERTRPRVQAQLKFAAAPIRRAI